MKEYRNEIIIALVSIIGAILATWFFFFSIDEKKITVQSDLFSVVAPNPNALLCINRPSMLSKIILSDDYTKKIFAPHLPPVFAKIIDKNPGIPFYLISYHEQGEVIYANATLEQAYQIADNILHPYFSSFDPKRTLIDKAEFTFYALPGNRFFVTYYNQGVWAASFSKKLLDEICLQQKIGQTALSDRILSQKKLMDRNAPLNLLMPAPSLDISVQINDSIRMGLGNGWVYADLFSSDGKLCCFSGIPYNAQLDSIYPIMADSVVRRLKTFYPNHNFLPQLSKDAERIYFTACLVQPDSVSR